MTGTDAVRNALDILEKRRLTTVIGADLRSLAEILADELIYIHSSGNTDTKPSLLAKLESGYLDYLEIENSDQEITVAGPTAVVTGRMTARVRVDGSLRTPNSKTLAVWTLRDEVWQLLAFHAVAVPES